MRLVLTVQRCVVTLSLCAAAFAAACASHPAVSIHYAIIQGDSVVTRDKSVDESRMKSLRDDVGGDFVWFNRNGVEYVSTNPATIALASKNIAPAFAAWPERAYARDDGFEAGFIPAANMDPFQPGSFFELSPDPDQRMNLRLSDFQEKLVLADRRMNDLLDAALRNNDAHPVAATPKPVATYELNGRRMR